MTKPINLEQAALLYEAIRANERKNLISNIASYMQPIDKEVMVRQLCHFYQDDKNYDSKNCGYFRYYKKMKTQIDK